MSLGIGVSTSRGYTSSGGVTTLGINTQSSGSLLVVGGAWEGGSTRPTLSDSNGNTWTPIGSVYQHSSGFSGYTGLWYCENATGGSSHTFTLSKSNGFPTIFVLEVTGAATSGALDQNTGAGDDTSSPVTSGSVTTTTANQILIGLVGVETSADPAFTANNSFTKQEERTASASEWCGALSYRIVSATGTYETSFGVTNLTRGAAFIATFKELAGGTVDQEGFRFGNDDGSESTHTWVAAQDTNVTHPLDTNLLYRGLINATGDPASAAYSLRYQKNGSGGYAAIPVGASVTTSPAQPSSGTATTVGTASTTWTLNRPTASSGDMIVYVVAWDDSTNVTSVTAPAGPNSETAVSIAGPVASNSTEMRMQAWYYLATGSWSGGTSNWTPSASETCRAVAFVIPAAEFNASDPIGWSSTSASAGTAESNINSPTGTAESNDGSGRLFIGFGSDADAITAPGSGTTTVNNSTGGGVGLCVVSRNSLVSNSESISAITATIASDSWASLAFVVKPKVVNNEIYIATSANIAAGGEDTTNLLTPPSGKSPSDYDVGRRWDDENGTDSTDITSDDFTEFEWCIRTQSPAVNGDYYDLRVYSGGSALASYSVTGRWTVGAAGSDFSSSGVGAASGVGATVSTTVASSAGVGAGAGVSAAIWRSDFASAGVATASANSAIVSGSVGSSSGLASSDGVGGSIYAGVFSSSATSAATGIGAAAATSVYSAAGVGAASGTGSSFATTVYSSSGTSSASGVSAAIAETVYSSSGIATATGVGEDANGGGSVSYSIGTATADAVGSVVVAAIALSDGIASSSAQAQTIAASVFASSGVAAATAEGQDAGGYVASAAGTSTATAVGRTSLHGVTRDRYGNILGECRVMCFRTSDNAFLGEDESDTAGNYVIYPEDSGPFFLVSYKAGTPDTFGTTVNTLEAS